MACFEANRLAQCKALSTSKDYLRDPSASSISLCKWTLVCVISVLFYAHVVSHVNAEEEAA